MLALGGGVRGRGPLGQGAKLGLQRLVLLFVFEKKPSGVKTEEKTQSTSSFSVFLDAWPGSAPASIST